MREQKFYRNLVILNGAVPLLVLGWDAYRGQLGANSVNYALHVTGILSLVFLFLSLAISPLRWLTGSSHWLSYRRALGLYGFLYSVIHVAIYVGLDRELSVASTLNEIWTRRFLQIGTAAVFLMVPLAATSTNAMIRQLGAKNWKLLHRLAYVAAILGVVHYYMLVKSDVRQPVAFAVVLTGLLGARVGWNYLELKRSANKMLSKSVAAERSTRRKFWTGDLRIASIVQETPSVRTFRFSSIDGGSVPFDYAPGQYMNLKLTIDGKRVNRSYTIASSPSRSAYCELSIKREPGGLASNYIHDNWKVGDIVRVSAPAGRFVFDGQSSSNVLLIAGGVGITPLMSMVRYLTDRSWTGDIFFLVIAKTENEIIFHDELRLLAARFPNLKICITLTQLPAESMWAGERGRATDALLHRFVPNLATLPVYLCGPDPMMESTRELLVKIGVPNERIHTEAFVSPAASETASDDAAEMAQSNEAHVDGGPAATTAHRIEFARSKDTVDVASDTSVLEAAEERSIDLPFECRSGICGQCKIRKLAGEVYMETEDALSASEKANGYILACQSHPRSSVVVVDA